jgi:hypothetical protein
MGLYSCELNIERFFFELEKVIRALSGEFLDFGVCDTRNLLTHGDNLKGEKGDVSTDDFLFSRYT